MKWWKGHNFRPNIIFLQQQAEKSSDELKMQNSDGSKEQFPHLLQKLNILSLQVQIQKRFSRAYASVPWDFIIPNNRSGRRIKHSEVFRLINRPGVAGAVLQTAS